MRSLFVFLTSAALLVSVAAEAAEPPAPTTATPPVDATSSATAGEAPPTEASVDAAAAPPPVVEPTATDTPTSTEPPPVTVVDPEPVSLEAAMVSDPAEDIAPPSKPPSPFDQKSLRIGVVVGWAQANTTDWLILGGGVGYYVLDGLEVSADANFWLIGDPFIATVTPGVRYVFHMVPDIKPYVGAFYRHYFVDRAGFDSDSIGGRVGINFMVNPHAYVGGGLVVEQMVNNNLFQNDTQVYPEITFALAF